MVRIYSLLSSNKYAFYKEKDAKKTNTMIGNILGIASQGASMMGDMAAREHAQGLQSKANKEMMELQFQNQLDMWNRTNVGEQIKHMKKAGLNPALMFGQAGAGGTTGSLGAGSSGLTNPKQMDIGNAMQQMQLTSAQTENIKAETEKIKAETEKTQGVDTDKTKSETAVNTAQELLTRVNTTIAEIRKEIEGETKYDTITRIEQEARKAIGDAVQAQVAGVVSENTQKEQQDKIIWEAQSAMIEAQAKRQGIKLNEAQINKINTELKQGWERLKLEARGQDISVKNMEELTETMLWQSGINATGNLVNGLINLRTGGIKETVSEHRTNTRGETSEMHRTTTRK